MGDRSRSPVDTGMHNPDRFLVMGPESNKMLGGLVHAKFGVAISGVVKFWY